MKSSTPTAVGQSVSCIVSKVKDDVATIIIHNGMRYVLDMKGGKRK